MKEMSACFQIPPSCVTEGLELGWHMWQQALEDSERPWHDSEWPWHDSERPWHDSERPWHDSHNAAGVRKYSNAIQ